VKLKEAKAAVDELRAAGGVIIEGCSLCVRLVAKGNKPKPCPVCGAPVQPAKKRRSR